MTSISHSLRRSRSLAIALLAGAVLLILAGAPSARAFSTGPDHIAVSVSPKTPAVGQPITITAVLKDASNQTFPASGIGLWGDTAGVFHPSAFAQFVNGVATVTVPFDKPLHNDAITVQFSGGLTGQSRAFNVLGPLDHLTTSIPSGLKVNAPFNVTVSARDAADNLLTGYAGALAWSDSASAPGLPSPSAFTGGVSKTSVQLSAPVRSDRLTITTGGLSVTKTLNVIGPVTKLDLQAPASVAPATPFKVVAHARDAAGNVVPDYNAPASWIDSAGALTPSIPSAFVKGVSTTVAQFPAPVKPDVVTLTTSAFSAQRTISAVGPLDHIAVAWTTTSAGWNCASPMTGSLVARAVDAAGNVVTSYNDAAPSWFAAGSTTPAMSPAKPAPFVAGVSTNPDVTISATGVSAVEVWVATGGNVGTVRACG